MKKSKFTQLMLLLSLTPGAVAWAGSNALSDSNVFLSQQTGILNTEGIIGEGQFGQNCDARGYRGA